MGGPFVRGRRSKVEGRTTIGAWGGAIRVEVTLPHKYQWCARGRNWDGKIDYFLARRAGIERKDAKKQAAADARVS